MFKIYNKIYIYKYIYIYIYISVGSISVDRCLGGVHGSNTVWGGCTPEARVHPPQTGFEPCTPPKQCYDRRHPNPITQH